MAPGALVAALGTLASVAAAAVVAWVWIGGAAFSLPHSIHSRVATISQAKIRKTRVWFMGDRQAQPRTTGGVVAEGEAAGIVTGAGDRGNASAGSAPLRVSRPWKAATSSGPVMRAAAGRATTT